MELISVMHGKINNGSVSYRGKRRERRNKEFGKQCTYSPILYSAEFLRVVIQSATECQAAQADASFSNKIQLVLMTQRQGIDLFNHNYYIYTLVIVPFI